MVLRNPKFGNAGLILIYRTHVFLGGGDDVPWTSELERKVCASAARAGMRIPADTLILTPEVYNGR